MDIQEIQLAQTATRTAAASSTPSGSGFSDSLKQAASQGGTASMDEIFARASVSYGVPLNLLKAVAKAESSFRADVTSQCGAMGVMQLMPGTAKALGVTDPYNAEQNIMGGAKYLSNMLKKYDGNASLALAAYNAGSGAVAKYDGIPPYPETQNYVKKVLAYAGQDLGFAGTVRLPATSPVGVGSGEADLLPDLDWSSIHSLEELITALTDQEGTTTPQEAAQIYGILSPMVQSQMTGNLTRGLFDDGEDDTQQLQDQMRYLFL